MILGALLAAGTGARFGDGTESRSDDRNKLLADLDGKPVVTRAARTLTESSLDAAVAVVGHDREAVERALPDGIETVANPDYGRGQSASVRRAVAVARERGADAAVFALGDMPCVEVATVEAILREYRDGRGDDVHDSRGGTPGIVAPRHEGRRGNPVLFDARYFDELDRVEGDAGGRALLESDPVTWVEVADPGVHRDVDTERDLRDLRRRQSESASRSGRE
ncbi:nucleotidyltransferase family protein [Halorussus aquaticus]|uniref:NTP transferase domain-containing protein n=1 Tax=Halorussus aquaticus TaxID=2953748 RepID=A0ABD5PYQ5_9EURY|nr:nucleotidyltransferase family protein [Halorussus aquaticus]